MPIRRDNENLYRDLSIIVQTYEEELARSDKPIAMKAMALKPIAGANRILNSTETVLSDSVMRLDSSVSHTKKDNTEEKGTDHRENLGDHINVDFGNELEQLTGNDNLLDYLDDCFNCDLRLEFKWQIAPFNLFDSILDLLEELQRAIDLLEAGLDPLSFLKDLCDLLNNLKWLCLPDLIALLVSLQTLLKIKTTNLLKISFDWTVLLAPLLQAVLQLLDMLMDGAFDVVSGPVECIFGALKTVADLEKAVVGVGNQLDTLGGTVDGFVEENYRSVSPGENLEIDIQNSTGGTQIEPSDMPGAFDFYTGTDFDIVSISGAIADPSFANAHWTSKLLVPIAELRRDVNELRQKLDDALASLKGLTSSGLVLQFESIVGILYIMQMIQLCKLLIKILREFKGGDFSFCEDLKNSPEKYNNILSSVVEGLHLSIQDDNTIIANYKGQQIVTSQPCLKNNSILNSWIQDLNTGRSIK